MNTVAKSQSKTLLSDAEITAAFNSANGERKHFEATFGTYSLANDNVVKTLTASDKPAAERLAREYGARFLGKKLVYVYLRSTDPKPAEAPAPVLEDAQSVIVVTVNNGENIEHVHAIGCRDIERTLNSNRYRYTESSEYGTVRSALDMIFGDVARDNGDTGSAEYEEAILGEVGSRLIIKPCVPKHLRDLTPEA